MSHSKKQPVLPAHFDGTQILLDEPFELKPNTKLLVTVLEETDAETEAWQAFSLSNLEAAYSDQEPEYPLAAIKSPNPEYEGR